ncbi:LpxL/LpxP family Kdo(2)-lipid IV(A) lauroyl/palmitoleoyl acyltransferase [Paraferrimonas haliotis]|uniref:Lipid A biosynthesis acyltransferase n=1 Tax=Paraferrimonas haliotis TaxID=2013866 RepID=A0AA37WX94_9GAMM|nr:LpxL/LpxP family Kdo(2)-lipid IV(A) lauroyl/palmitoleoyl acyltransferase [Paraferrimonas haliotis]GLS83194.1 lipid A biosynthesis lauroyltransferase [Paraferrimonas haliotis]
MITKAQFSAQLLHPKYWLIWFFAGLLWLTTRLPLPIQMKMGAGLGRLVHRFLKKRVHTAQRNLELCFPEMSEQERQHLVKRNFEETGKAIFDSVNAWWWSDKRVRQHMDMTGVEHIEQTLNDGNGVVLFAVHALCLEMGPRVLTQESGGYGVFRPNDNPLLEYLQTRGRLKSAKGMIPKKGAVRGMLETLHMPDLIWYTADQDFGPRRAVFAPWFGVEQAATITAATMLAKQGNAKILPFFVERTDGDKGYRVVISPPLENFPGDNELEDAKTCNKVVESIISQNKAQYMWLHRRFKTRPDGQGSLY